MSIPEICKIDGIGPAKATQIKAALEPGKRLYKENAKKQKKIKNPDDIKLTNSITDACNFEST